MACCTLLKKKFGSIFLAIFERKQIYCLFVFKTKLNHLSGNVAPVLIMDVLRIKVRRISKLPEIYEFRNLQINMILFAQCSSETPKGKNISKRKKERKCSCEYIFNLNNMNNLNKSIFPSSTFRPAFSEIVCISSNCFCLLKVKWTFPQI